MLQRGNRKRYRYIFIYKKVIKNITKQYKNTFTFSRTWGCRNKAAVYGHLKFVAGSIVLTAKLSAIYRQLDVTELQMSVYSVPYCNSAEVKACCVCFILYTSVVYWIHKSVCISFNVNSIESKLNVLEK